MYVQSSAMVGNNIARHLVTAVIFIAVVHLEMIYVVLSVTLFLNILCHVSYVQFPDHVSSLYMTDWLID